jgi:hypothetical protein
VSEDKVSPIEVVGEQDLNRVDTNLASVYWDRNLVAGKMGRLSFTLRNPHMMQMNTWPSQTISDFIDSRIVDSQGTSLKGNCIIKFGFGLYEGEYFGWYLCSQTAPALKGSINISILYGPPTATASVLQNLQLPIALFSANAT